MPDGKDPQTRLDAMIDAVKVSRLHAGASLDTIEKSLRGSARTAGMVPSVSTFNAFARAQRRLREALDDLSTTSLAVEAEAHKLEQSRLSEEK